MILKILCLCACSAGFVASCSPPRSSTTKSKQTEKSEDESLTIRIAVALVPINSIIHALGTLVYIALMVYTEHHGTDRGHSISGYRDVDVALRKLLALETWQVMMTLLSVFSSGFRLWSFVTLDRLFTYALFIHKDHKLVVTGPYRYTRHPAYAGLATTIATSYLLLLHQGLWPIFTSWIGASFQSHVLPHAPSAFSFLLSVLRMIPFWAQISGPNGGAWVVLPMTGAWLDMIHRRIKTEEAMLREQFGEEWDRYARERWSLIPFVY